MTTYVCTGTIREGDDRRPCGNREPEEELYIRYSRKKVPTTPQGVINLALCADCVKRINESREQQGREPLHFRSFKVDIDRARERREQRSSGSRPNAGRDRERQNRKRRQADPGPNDVMCSQCERFMAVEQAWSDPLFMFLPSLRPFGFTSSLVPSEDFAILTADHLKAAAFCRRCADKIRLRRQRELPKGEDIVMLTKLVRVLERFEQYKARTAQPEQRQSKPAESEPTQSEPSSTRRKPARGGRRNRQQRTRRGRRQSTSRPTSNKKEDKVG